MRNLRRLKLCYLVFIGWLYSHAASAATAKDAQRFTEQLIANDFGYAYGVAAADIDGDGDLDLTSADATKNSLYWYENDGQGTFQQHPVMKDEPNWFERHAIGDVDGDGHADVVVVKNLSGQVVWFRNSGTPRYGKLWERHVASTRISRAYDVALTDLDGDGDLDIAATAWSGNYIAWFENPGKAASEEWAQYRIDENIGETRTVRVADFNGDGRPDLLCTARQGNLVAWYENTDKLKTELWPRHVIDDQSQQPVHGQPVDMDGDGDFDVVMAFGMLSEEPATQIAWYENVGQGAKGAEWKRHVVGDIPFGFEAVAGDLDSDGDLDLVASGWGGQGCVVWFENRGAGEWAQHQLKSPWARANQVIIADLNGDKKPDVVATAENGSNELRWWRNQGAAGK